MTVPLERNLPVLEAIPSHGNLIIVGGFGSGKTEVSVNLARQSARAGRRVRLVDLDIVNPYFRCREARSDLEAEGVEVIAPHGSYATADLPIILPRLASLFRDDDQVLNLFDVGGDDLGARVLSSFRQCLDGSPYDLWQVINGRRPFTQSPGGCRRMKEEIERSSRAQVTGLLVNTHLMDETTPEIVVEGWKLAREAARAQGLHIPLVAIMDRFAGQPNLDQITEPILWMRRAMLPPWSLTIDQPAGVVRPIGKPGPILAGL